MARRNATPPASQPHPEEQEQEFLAPDDAGWHYTIMRDWIAVCPDLGATAARLYWIVRSIMHEKGERKRRLSLDQLAWLLPGINGKPTSEGRIKDALRELDAIGLLSNPDGDVVRRWVTDPDTGRRRKENYRRWQVHDYPAAGSAYTGWRSAIAKLDDYPGPGWRTNATGSIASTEGQKTAPQSSTRRSPAKTRNTAGHTEGQKSVPSRQKSASPRQKSAVRKPVSSTNTAPKESPQGISPTNQPRNEVPVPEPNGSKDGWRDGSVLDTSAGAMLLATVEHRHGAYVHANRTEHIQTLDEALGILNQDELVSALGDGLAAAHHPSGALVSRLQEIPRRVHTRQAQQADRAAQSGRARAHVDQNPSHSPRAEQATQQEGSPVDWLTDAQYTALSPQDKAHLRAWSDTPEEELTAHAARTITAIRDRCTQHA